MTYAYEPKTPGKGRFAHMTGPGLPAYGVRYGRLADSDLVEYTRCKADNAVRAKYTWGLDLSGLAGVVQASLPASGIHGAGGTLDTLGEGQGQVGGLHGAGGIGSLLAREEPQAVGDPKRHWYLYDANGNVGQLLEYVAGTPPTVTLAAHYEYDPYGSIIRRDDVDNSGVVDANPFGFSTKWIDWDLYYYGGRFYSPRLGRWMSRDPMAEFGGVNLYLFVHNAPLGAFDVLGLMGCCASPCTCEIVQDYPAPFIDSEWGLLANIPDPDNKMLSQAAVGQFVGFAAPMGIWGKRVRQLFKCCVQPSNCHQYRWGEPRLVSVRVPGRGIPAQSAAMAIILTPPVVKIGLGAVDEKWKRVCDALGDVGLSCEILKIDLAGLLWYKSSGIQAPSPPNGTEEAHWEPENRPPRGCDLVDKATCGSGLPAGAQIPPMPPAPPWPYRTLVPSWYD